MANKKSTFFDLSKANQADINSHKYIMLLKIISAFPSFKKIQKWHDTAINEEDFKEFLGSVLKQMHVNIEHVGTLNIPKNGACIFIANHPTGLLEVVVWLNTILSVRPDLKMMANNWFDFLEVAQDNLIMVNTFDSKTSYKQNVKSIIEAKKHLEKSGSLMLFPAGEVAHWDWKSLGVSDPPWKKSILSLSKKTNATIIPCYSSSKNSLLFNVVGNIHPRLRTLMLAREFTSKQRKTIKIATNANVDNDYLDRYTTDSQKMVFLRLCTEALNDKPFADHLADNEEIIKQIDTALIKQELNDLEMMADTDRYSVYSGYGSEMPNTIKEIGRLREYNFRMIGEGSGKDLDSDKYDEYYKQMFLWDKEESRILGGLRVGFGDGLNNKEVYFLEVAKIKPKFNKVLAQSLDFGRLFVVDDAPKELNVILILVRSLVSYFRKSKYNYLIGQVSIPSIYPKLALDIIIKFLKYHYLDAQFSVLVKGRRKFRLTRKNMSYLNELIPVTTTPKAINMLLHKLFQGRIEIPALLRFYLKCNTKLMNVNYDKDFGTVDALMIVHRDQIPRFFK